MTQIKWIFQHLKGCRLRYAMGIILHNLVFLPLMIIGPMILSELIDAVYANGNPDVAVSLLIKYLIVGVIGAVSYYGYALLQDMGGAHVLASFRGELYEKLQSLSMNFFGATRTGDIMMRLTGDLDTIRHFTGWVLSHFIYCVLLFICGFAVFFSTSIKLTLIVMTTLPFMAIVVFKLRKHSSKYHRQWREKNSSLNAYVQENIAANRIVKAFAREKYEAGRFAKHNEAYRDAGIKAAGVWAHYGPYLAALSNALNILILVFGGIFVINDTMSLGDLFLFYNLSWLITDSVNIIGIVINDSQKFFSSTHKVLQLYNSVADIKNCENPLVKEPDENSGTVEFKNVSFAYGSHTVLKDICLQAEKGQTIGIMGPTGSGKTTLVMLIARFLDVHKGSVLIDGTDVKKYDLNCLRHHVGYAMQDVFLFSDNVSSNIAYGNASLSDEEIKNYAVMSDAHNFIKRMPEKYDTVIGERGVGLSGGQKQRIALARALAYEAPILVLDDTTSAVDMETEHYIQEQLASRKNKQTTFIVAQRISSVKNADRIYILQDGRITESGTHEELLAKKGYYYDIFCIQQGANSPDEEEVGV